jgi:hypothetical protein
VYPCSDVEGEPWLIVDTVRMELCAEALELSSLLSVDGYGLGCGLKA